MKEPEKKLKGIAYARAYNKLNAFARSLEWDIRLLYRAGEVEVETRKDDSTVLRYSTAGRCVSLSINPHTSEAKVKDSTSGEEYVYPIYDDYVLERCMEGIDHAEEDFRLKLKGTELKPKMNEVL